MATSNFLIATSDFAMRMKEINAAQAQQIERFIQLLPNHHHLANPHDHFKYYLQCQMVFQNAQ